MGPEPVSRGGFAVWNGWERREARVVIVTPEAGEKQYTPFVPFVRDSDDTPLVVCHPVLEVCLFWIYEFVCVTLCCTYMYLPLYGSHDSPVVVAILLSFYALI
jgi:hypothetical protein